MNTRRYPYDVHGAAQGIISFTKAAEQAPEFLALARKIKTWALAHSVSTRFTRFCLSYQSLGQVELLPHAVV